MNKLSILLLGLFWSCGSLVVKNTPQDTTLLKVADEPVLVDEFIYAFNKNRSIDSLATKAAIDDYLELYINFKLKVKEAKMRGMDTTLAFKKEYSSYVNQLDNSYLQSNNETDALVEEAYNRLQYEIRAAHILFAVAEADSPADTLAAYEKAIMVRDSLLGGTSFAELAKAYSIDPSAQKNGGDLGYFTVLQMVYSFETAAYNTEVGQVSLPTRTKFGYHLIKVVDKKPNEGRVKVAHIMIRNSDAAKNKAFEIYDQLTDGADWDEYCQQYSEDAQSKDKAGVLAPFNRRQIVPSFAEAAFNLSVPGEISEPIQTPYGWHIIKLIEKLPIGDFEENKQQLRTKIKRDSRAQLSRQKMIERLAHENNLVENLTNVQAVITPGNHHFENKKWLFEDDSLQNVELFSINGDNYYAYDLFAFINKSSQHKNTKSFLFDKYKRFKDESLIEFEKAHLAEKHGDYKYLIQEYYDGILLFSIMENEVWAKAGQDSLGLRQYYEDNKTDFIDSSILSAAIFSSDNQSIIDLIASEVKDTKAYRSLSKEEKDSLVTRNNGMPQLSLHLDSGEFVIDEHPVLQNLSLPYKESIINVDEKWYYVLPLSNPALPLPMENVMGKLIAAYQEVLEEKWLIKLKETYDVSVDETALKKVYKKLETF
jgi:peptidyl-prolyl cis-trans isomerase SurA